MREQAASPAPEEAISTTAPFTEEIVSDPIAPFPEETSETPDTRTSEAMPVVEDVDEVATPVYRDNQNTGEVSSQNSKNQAFKSIDAINEQIVAAQTSHATGDDVYESGDELQQLLAQIEATRQQLQEARARLEAAKKRESQLITTRLQLKELQAELQATLAELEERPKRS